jgi:hypothetical protein
MPVSQFIDEIRKTLEYLGAAKEQPIIKLQAIPLIAPKRNSF